MDRLWRSNSSISSRTGCPLGIVNSEDHKVESCGATVSMCLHGMNSKILKNNTLSMADASLNDHAYFNASCLYEKRDREHNNTHKGVDTDGETENTTTLIKG